MPAETSGRDMSSGGEPVRRRGAKSVERRAVKSRSRSKSVKRSLQLTPLQTQLRETDGYLAPKIDDIRNCSTLQVL